ncbi:MULTISPECIES: Bug family tripartite tricarboxylate transporter substrate binding protein [Ramlibacter]|uniref:Tripartite tricarboxylate transporter substrate binding protein n=1 Tax=Ramlibacter pinisoli TaxID=2682844 RepID=A0A6N8IU11_9BURK|nr:MULTISPECIES: tripartite tricarboxylate transporter substrate binding protein [Ramlibacter]MBA2965227.1 tripartite tricarboxylate transporter substrate binding protein [Ramlibacter sp. CGMCC 1.13660]MVQ30192.1 tripartite tricarboxylate transporter substrate binding protein [Ramlibacter pinisoli]
MSAFPISRRQLLVAASGAVAAPLAFAQTWPTRPVRLVVAGPAGGSADLVARLVSEPLSKELGQPVIVDNRPGAAGAIAVGELLQAQRDGHTLLVGVNSLVSEIPHIVKLRWDMFKEVRPLAELARGGLVLVGHPSAPGKDLKELVAYAKANPGKLNYASYSPGTLSHVLGLQLNQAAGIQLVHVGYKGSTPALADVMGNHVPLMFDGLATSLPLLKGGKIKAYAVSSPQRAPQLPDVPTFREAGYPQLDALGWMGLWSTPDAPAAAQQRVREATLKVLSDAGVRTRMLDTGFEAGSPRTTEEMAKVLKTDYDRVGGVLQSINFKPE